MTDFADRARQATQAMRALFPPTPLLRNDHLSGIYGADIWLKREDLSPVRSYKIRGAFNAMRKVLAHNPGQKVFVCASAGNHAQGVAFVCRHFGVRGQIFMPVTTPQQKIDKTRMFGQDAVEVQLVGDYFDDTLAAAKQHCDTVGGHFLAPFDDDDVIEGQASVGVELVEQMGGVPDRLVLPVGGGGLSAALTGLLEDDCALTYAEPEDAASLYAAVRAGAPVTLDTISNFVDGAAVARIGERPFARLADVTPTDIVRISEDRLCTTIVEMLNVEGVVLEPAGALAVDALKDLADIRGQRIVCVTSGGNFDFERLPEVKERAQRFLGVKKYFIFRMPQRPGALRDFLNLLGPEDDITRFEYLKKSARNFGSVLIGIETLHPQNFDAFTARLEQSGFSYTDITGDEMLAQFLI